MKRQIFGDTCGQTFYMTRDCVIGGDISCAHDASALYDLYDDDNNDDDEDVYDAALYDN